MSSRFSFRAQVGDIEVNSIAIANKSPHSNCSTHSTPKKLATPHSSSVSPAAVAAVAVAAAAVHYKPPSQLKIKIPQVAVPQIGSRDSIKLSPLVSVTVPLTLNRCSVSNKSAKSAKSTKSTTSPPPDTEAYAYAYATADVDYQYLSPGSYCDNLTPLYTAHILQVTGDTTPPVFSLAPLSIQSPTPIDCHIDIINHTNYHSSADSDYDFNCDIDLDQLQSDFHLEEHLIAMGCCCLHKMMNSNDDNDNDNDDKKENDDTSADADADDDYPPIPIPNDANTSLQIPISAKTANTTNTANTSNTVDAYDATETRSYNTVDEQKDLVSPIPQLDKIGSLTNAKRPSSSALSSPLHSVRLSITPKGHLAPIHIMDHSDEELLVCDDSLSSTDCKEEEEEGKYGEIATPVHFLAKHQTITKFVSSQVSNTSDRNVLLRRKRRHGVQERHTLTFSKPPIAAHELPSSPKFAEIDLDVQKPRDYLNRILKDNLLFSGVDPEFKEKMVCKAVDLMRAADFEQEEILIHQGAEGDAFYAVEYGNFDILVMKESMEQITVASATKGDCVGEYALLYNQPRTATLLAREKSRVWGITAGQFASMRQEIMDWNVERFERRQEFIHSIPLFQKLEQHELLNMTHACHAEIYDIDDFIITKSENTNVYIIMEGTIVVSYSVYDSHSHSNSDDSHSNINNDDEKVGINIGVCRGDKELGPCDYFARNLFYENEYDEEEEIVCARAHTRCKVLKIARDDFVLIMAATATATKQYLFNDKTGVLTGDGALPNAQNWKNKIMNLELDDLEEKDVLGIGSFGRVTLVENKETGATYALKSVSKYRVVKTGQEAHIINEKRVLCMLDSPFCVKLYATFKTESTIYFLTEVVLGGELFTVLRYNEKFDKNATRFYAGCVVMALEHLHSMDIIYRDLKPENLLLNKRGYLQLTDFGFAKKRNTSCTLCGTPQYLAPEVIHNWVQSFATDWWALGVLLYEMVVGHPPFEDDENIKMYEKILVHEPAFPHDINSKLRHLIQKLLEKNAYQRLGSGAGGARQVKLHPFFRNKLNWEDLNDMKLEAPYKPNIVNNFDTSNFDHYDDFEDFSDDEEQPEIDPDSPHFQWVDQF